MHRRDPRQAGVVRVSAAATVASPDISRSAAIFFGAAQKDFDFCPVAHHETMITPIDQQRAAQEEPVIGAGETEIVLAGLA